MRPRLRLFSAMLALALVAVVLSILARVWHRHDAARRYQHAVLARRWSYVVWQRRGDVRFLKSHGEHGFSCDVCRPRSRPLAKLLADAETELRQAEATYEWHRRVAGPSVMREVEIPVM